MRVGTATRVPPATPFPCRALRSAKLLVWLLADKRKNQGPHCQVPVKELLASE
jgi:hypothetical protein